MNRKAHRTLRILSIPLIISVGVAIASDYSLDWYTIDGGGEMWIAGGDFELSGTIGQPDAGATMTGGDFELTGGFWVFGHAVAPDEVSPDALDPDDEPADPLGLAP